MRRQALGLLRAGIGAVHRAGGEQEHRQRLLGRHRDLQQLAAQQRIFDDGLAERLRGRAHSHRLVDAAPHHRGGAHAVRQPRQVDLLHHLLEAAVGLADQIGDGALQPDLARGHRAGAELVLEPDDPIGVAAAVLEPARQREQREPPGAGGRAFGPRQQQRDIGVGMRAEPFVAVQPPGAVLVARRGFDRADVGAAGVLGHELRALPHRGESPDSIFGSR